MTNPKYPMPDFLTKYQQVTQKSYERWLDRKASSQYRRDKKYHTTMKQTRQDYKKTIHQAVINSKGLDYYTGNKLDWNALSTFGKENGYKKIPNLPTVDHINRKNAHTKIEFVICSWQLNDMKNDLSYKEFLELCKKVLAYSKSKEKE